MTVVSGSRWPELFSQAMRIIDQASSGGIAFDDWTFGGGTALMLQIGHRESDDIDLFFSDPQWLPLLNPMTQGYVLDVAPSDYETDGARVLKLAFSGIGEIDFICCAPLTIHYSERREVCGRNVAMELPAEIIAKKIFYRGERMQPRDMFDIAAVIECCPESDLVKELRPFAGQCEKALRAIARMDPATIRDVMKNLRIRPAFNGIPDIALERTGIFLERVVSEVER